MTLYDLALLLSLGPCQSHHRNGPDSQPSDTTITWPRSRAPPLSSETHLTPTHACLQAPDREPLKCRVTLSRRWALLRQVNFGSRL
jgi:hypothetical protein